MKKVLCLDGGGIRGYLTARVLETTGLRGEDFDLIVGTSTGGILALYLAAGGNPNGVVRLYKTRGRDIFPRKRLGRANQLFGPKYSPDGLTDALFDTFGLQLFGHLPTKTMVTSFDLTAQRAFLFKSWKPESLGVSVLDAAMATSAAPTFFPPHALGKSLLVDGGVYANNPAAMALTEAVKLWGADEDIRILSVGCGKYVKANAYAGARSWGVLGWLPRLAPVFMDSATDVVDYQVEKVLGKRYTRIQAPLLREVAMDDASEDAFEEMEGALRYILPGINNVVRDFKPAIVSVG